MKILCLFAAAFVAIDARPQFISSLGGNIISSYISNTPQVETFIVKSQPAVNYAYLPQPLVARPYAGDTLVINAKPTVVYDSPKRIIYRKITCYSDDCNPSDFGGSSSSSSNNNRFTPTLNSGNNGQGGADISDDEDGSTAIGFGRRNTRRGGSGGGGRREAGFGRR